MNERATRVLSVLLLAIAEVVSAETPLASFDAYVREAVAEWGPPGLAIAVVHEGEVVFSESYGVRELGKPERVDEHTLFAIGSTTKAITAAAIGILVDEGRLSWDDPVTEHLPWFRVADPWVTRELTVRDLLTHRGGLPNTDFLWYGRDASARNVLERMRHVETETSLRSAFTYQNVMYAAAGAVLEAASGVSWDRFVRARILLPLGMTETVPIASSLPSGGNVASPHYRLEGEVRVIENASVDAVSAAGSIWSSIADMSRWARFCLEGKSPGGERLLTEETHRELFAPQTLVDADEFYPTQRLTKPHWTTYGLGWFQQDYDGRAVDFHTGSIDGMVAIVGLIRDERLGVVVLSNLDHAELRHALMLRVFDLYGAGAARDWSRELKELYDELAAESREREAERRGQRVTGTEPRLPLPRYAGAYEDPLYGTVTVTATAAGLRFHHGPGLRGELRHWHYDVFEADWDAAWRGSVLVSFELGPSGEPDMLEARGMRFRRVPE